MQIFNRYILTLAFTLLGFGVSAQDVIRLKNGSVINARIQNIENDRVHYYEFKDSTTVFTLNRSLISSIEKEDLEKKSKFLNTYKQQIKLEMLSVSLRSIGLSYERSLTPGSSIEGIIIGDFSGEDKGIELGAEYRIYFKRANKKEEIIHDLLTGYYTSFYVGLGLQDRRFQRRNFTTFMFEEGSKVSQALLTGLGIGYQWQLESITIDISTTFVYYFGSSKETLDGGGASKGRLIEYDNGIFRGNDNRGIYPKLKVGYQF